MPPGSRLHLSHYSSSPGRGSLAASTGAISAATTGDRRTPTASVTGKLSASRRVVPMSPLHVAGRRRPPCSADRCSAPSGLCDSGSHSAMLGSGERCSSGPSPVSRAQEHRYRPGGSRCPKDLSLAVALTLGALVVRRPGWKAGISPPSLGSSPLPRWHWLTPRPG